MNHRLTVLFALALASCGPAQQEEAKDPAQSQPVTEKLRITNINQSDLAVCFPKAPAVPDNRATAETLTGLLVAARPHVMECLVDPTRRGAEKETRVTIKSTLGASGVESAVTGQNLTPEGEKCIKATLSRYFATVPQLATPAAAGAAPVTAEIPVQHIAGVSPAVTLGINEGSDITGTVRLMQSTWCDCYAEWKDAPPSTLKAKIKIAKGTSVAPTDVTFEPTNDPAADKVAACLKDKVKALRFKVSTDELTLPYTFLFLHSSHDGVVTNAPPEIQFAQLDALRGQRAAAAVVAVGARSAAAVVYDDLVKKYKAKPASVPVDDLKSRCADLLKADDGWVASIEKQIDIDQKTVTLIGQLKAKDPGWAKAEAAAQSNLDATKKDLELAKKTRSDDSGICPKERF
jgi:hypothetical protein